ncbi:MAG: hypothetical protein D6699_08500 [Aquificota bacterium]|nr:MAG: hypothetical protein D6699_08500 [Aquificota bacterium]
MKKTTITIMLSNEQSAKLMYVPPFARTYMFSLIAERLFESIGQEVWEEIMELSLSPRSKRQEVKKRVEQIVEEFFASCGKGKTEKKEKRKEKKEGSNLSKVEEFL